MENPKNDFPSFIVIGIWVLIGLAIIFSLFDASKLKNVELYVQLVAVLVTIGTVYFAYRAVQVANEELNQGRADRKEELFFKRPYLSFLDGTMGNHPSKEEGVQSYINARFKNVGVNPAAEVEAKVNILNSDLGVEYSFDTSLANDIPSGFEFQTNRGGFYLNAHQETDNFFIQITIQYTDAILNDTYTQRYYLKWVSHDGIGATALYQPLKWEREQVNKVLGIKETKKQQPLKGESKKTTGCN